MDLDNLDIAINELENTLNKGIEYIDNMLKPFLEEITDIDI